MSVNPFRNTQVWDRLTLAGAGKRISTPAGSKVTVEVATGLEEDHRKTPGKSDTKYDKTILRYKEAEVKVSIQVFTEAQYDALLPLLSLVRPSRSGDTGSGEIKALDCVHPLLEFYGIKAMYCLTINQPPYTLEEGIKVDLSFKEWVSKTTVDTSGVKKDGSSGAGLSGAGLTLPAGLGSGANNGTAGPKLPPGGAGGATDGKVPPPPTSDPGGAFGRGFADGRGNGAGVAQFIAPPSTKTPKP